MVRPWGMAQAGRSVDRPQRDQRRGARWPAARLRRSCSLPAQDRLPLDVFGLSTLLVAVAEIGDKTQLLAIVLAARFRRPWPILAGILVATLANHALAATAGYFVSDLLEGAWFRALVGLGFLAMAV